MGATALLGLVAQAIQLGIPIAQEIIDGVNTAMSASGSKGYTPEEQAAIDTAYDAAHTALQAQKQGQQPGA